MDKNILLIEDDSDLAENISLLLEENGYKVCTARNGGEGILKAKEILPDLIVCDIIMNEINGYDVKQELNKDENTAVIPFVYLTAKVEKNDIRKGMGLGADDYLLKPFNSEELLQSIATRINKHDRFKTIILNREILEEKRKTFDKKDILSFKVRNSKVSIRIENIEFISAESQYSRIFQSEGKSLLLRKSLKWWEQSLPKNIFVRIHRNTIINIKYIKSVRKSDNGAYKVILTDFDKEFEISFRYTQKLRKPYPHLFDKTQFYITEGN